jgi:S1-C subfamily serine protease
MTDLYENPLAALSDALTGAVERAGAATVLVDARRRFPASGIVYAADLVLTADHVVEREDEIRLLLPSGEQATAELAGRDPGSDLVLLRLKGAPGLVAAERPAAPARLGQLVLALGRPSPAGLQASLGVISALGGPLRAGRGAMLERYLRTDATPYPGFSGGPLVDAAGLVLGLNTSGLWRGASLTIPVDLVWSIAAALAEHGSVKRGYLGIRSQPVAVAAAQRTALGREQTTGLLLVGIEVDSPAEKGGLLVGDILVGLAGEPLTDPDELSARLVGSLVGQPTAVEVLRGGQPVTLTVIIGERN